MRRCNYSKSTFNEEVLISVFISVSIRATARFPVTCGAVVSFLRHLSLSIVQKHQCLAVSVLDPGFDPNLQHNFKFNIPK
jgi:hypothetical protein